MQSAYLCVIFHVKHKIISFLAVLTWGQFNKTFTSSVIYKCNHCFELQHLEITLAEVLLN